MIVRSRSCRSFKEWSRSWFLGGDLRPQRTEVRTLGHGSIDGLPGDRMERAEVSANGIDTELVSTINLCRGGRAKTLLWWHR